MAQLTTNHNNKEELVEIVVSDISPDLSPPPQGKPHQIQFKFPCECNKKHTSGELGRAFAPQWQKPTGDVTAMHNENVCSEPPVRKGVETQWYL